MHEHGSRSGRQRLNWAVATRPAIQVAAKAPRGELYRSRFGHYDVYAGELDHANALYVEMGFLQRHARTATP